MYFCVGEGGLDVSFVGFSHCEHFVLVKFMHNGI